MITENQIWEKIHNKTKPLGSLGKLEEIAFRICKIQNSLNPQLKPIAFIFAADHGVVEEKVSAYPQEVTYQMVLNFLNGGAAMNVFCRQHSIPLFVVDAGVKGKFSKHDLLISKKVREGTRNFYKEPAMTEDELELALSYGKEIIDEYAKHKNLLICGEMGIGNTTSASAIMYALLDVSLDECVGYGTGISEEQLKRKKEVIETSIKSYQLKFDDPIKVLQFVGGYEIAMVVGAYLKAYEENMILLIDGFIATTSFLVAYKIQPEILNNAFFSHQSSERGHKILLDYFKSESILNLNLRLGEGTGAAIAFPILESAVRFLIEMADFDSAKVSKKILYDF
ncbi:MAG: nicotinate-nucleotide--dimethylbenzimidazole phosphoribosyltransferase [Leptospiraceae bacterium]|nr:nicotinate-nucleotide--dimethylbenzimidazole phosphoribosyltransferase [Leptospiraceae bacterium]MDW7975598.1 nicotinate-nucleotide--dimethylbenzimidazole phosphoribosyltransferase [Leptospiraceae bacterium]